MCERRPAGGAFSERGERKSNMKCKMQRKCAGESRVNACEFAMDVGERERERERPVRMRPREPEELADYGAQSERHPFSGFSRRISSPSTSMFRLVVGDTYFVIHCEPDKCSQFTLSVRPIRLHSVSNYHH